MIHVRGRTLVIPISERQIGTNYDNNSEVRVFHVERASGGIDISHLAFRLDLVYAGDVYDTCILETEVTDESILLNWQIPNTCMNHSGTVWVALRGTDSSGSVKWATNRGAFYVASTVDTPANASTLTELEQFEKLADEVIAKNDKVTAQAEKDLKEAEAYLKAETDSCTAKANETIEKAQKDIETANNTLNAVQGYAEQAEQSMEQSGDKAILSESWAVGKTGVRSGEDTNNSKYYSEISQNQAEKAKNEADRASMYADFVTPHFLIMNNRIYINEKSTVNFMVSENRLYFRLPG